MKSYLLPLFLLSLSVLHAVAAGFAGTLVAYDLPAGTITVGQGEIFKTFLFRPTVEVTLNGLRAKLEQFPMGSKVLIITTEPRMAGKIEGFAPGAAVAPVGGKAILNPKVEQLARACANLQDAELVLDGKPPRSLDQLQAHWRTSSLDALKKECGASIERALAVVESAAPQHRNQAFGYFKNGVTRLARGNEENLQGHEEWANKSAKAVVPAFHDLAKEAKSALEKE